MFVDEYLVDLNATQAAIRAGYGGSSRRSQEGAGAKLLAKPQVQKAINARMGERSRRTKITADWVLLELWEIARADLETNEHVRANDKLKALELLGKHLKLFTDVVEFDANITISAEPMSEDEWLKEYGPEHAKEIN